MRLPTPASGRLRLLVNNRKLGAASLAAADVAGKTVGFLITPYLANTMGAAEFGALNLYLSVTQILVFAIALGGDGLLAVEYIRNGYTSARRLRAANLWLSLWVSVALLVVGFTVSWLAPNVVPLATGALIVAVSFVQALNVCELSYYRGAQTYSWAVAGQFGFAVLNVGLTILAFQFNSPTVDNRLLSIALAGGLVQTAYLLELRRKSYEPANKGMRHSYTSMIVRFGVSIFPHVASQWIRLSVDRFIVSAYFGLAAGGIYSVAVTLAIVESVMFSAITQQLQPFLYRRLANRDFSGFWRIQAWFTLAVLVFTGLYYGFLMIFFELIFTSQYNDAKTLLPALLAGSAAQAIYHALALAPFYDRRAGQISLVTGTAMIIHVTGLGVLALSGGVTSSRVALVFFASSVIAMLGMAWMSRHVVGQLRAAGSSVEGHQESQSSSGSQGHSAKSQSQRPEL